jgi:hypothetical protein
MTSPYVDPKAQKYSPGNQNKGQKNLGTVQYAPTLCRSNSDGLRTEKPPAPNMISGAGKTRDQRKRQNPGFSL